MSVVDIPRRIPVTVMLRTPQMNYLRYTADRDSITLSRALAGIIASNAGLLTGPQRHIEKISQNFLFQSDHLETLDRIAARLGLTRSDVVRRLIDQARLGQMLEAG